jgi:hypothetical protein
LGKADFMRVPLPAAMITTLSAMRTSRWKIWIIGMLMALPLAGMGGCSSISLAYNNGPQLLWWWIDGYLDFNREQTPPVKQALDPLFDWHRSTQIPLYLPLLTAAQAQVTEPTSAALACRWQDQVRELLEPTLQRTLGSVADLLPSLGEAQIRHLEKRYTKVLAEMSDDFLQPDLAERHQQSVKRALERAERLYGHLDEPQRRVIDAGVAASPFNPQLWWQERQRRQRDTVQTLRRLLLEKADRDQRLAALRTLVARVERSPDAAYRSYQIKLADYNCAFAAQIHNATTPAQRQQARETLKAWDSDLRELMARE